MDIGEYGGYEGVVGADGVVESGFRVLPKGASGEVFVEGFRPTVFAALGADMYT